MADAIGTANIPEAKVKDANRVVMRIITLRRSHAKGLELVMSSLPEDCRRSLRLNGSGFEVAPQAVLRRLCCVIALMKSLGVLAGAWLVLDLRQGSVDQLPVAKKASVQ